jgi:hypothetical protein
MDLTYDVLLAAAIAEATDRMFNADEVDALHSPRVEQRVLGGATRCFPDALWSAREESTADYSAPRHSRGAFPVTAESLRQRCRGG